MNPFLPHLLSTVLEDALSNAQEKQILLPWGVGIVGYVASTKEIINIRDAYQVKWKIDMRNNVSVISKGDGNKFDNATGIVDVQNRMMQSVILYGMIIEIFNMIALKAARSSKPLCH